MNVGCIDLAGDSIQSSEARSRRPFARDEVRARCDRGKRFLQVPKQPRPGRIALETGHRHRVVDRPWPHGARNQVRRSLFRIHIKVTAD